MQILQEQKSALLPTSSPSTPHTLFDPQIGNCCNAGEQLEKYN
ncbi:hypothetical protein [Methylotuvimicrobium buryatense]|nr:hypothetical protein [Methylotuvimicrobium buryatense]